MWKSAAGFYIDNGNRNLAMPVIMSNANDLRAETIKVRRPGHMKPGGPMGARLELPKEKFSIRHNEVKPHLEEIFSPAWMFAGAISPDQWKYDTGKRIYIFDEISFTVLLTMEGQLKNPNFQQRSQTHIFHSAKNAEDAIIFALKMEDIQWFPLMPQ